ncbi:MAG: hypothetical protein M3P06_09690 [Acidobacteriota bacterium]|nr:hypothetical protein [Acidobacteriota bacterium]
MTASRLSLVLAVLFAVPAVAGETVVTLERDGNKVEGEVCRFRAGDAENPFRRWLVFDEVTCVPAGVPMQLPSGLWNVFGRIEGKAVSAPLAVEGIAVPANLSLTLDAAATLLPVLPSGHRGVVYAPRRNSAIPIAEGTPRITVPAGEDMWLLVAGKSRSIVAVIPIAALEADSERAIDGRVAGWTSAVMGWLQVPVEDRAALSRAQDLSAPRVRLLGEGPVLDSDPLPPPAVLNGAFFLVRGVSAGEKELRAEGRAWLPHTRRVTIADRPITIAAEPLFARGAAAINVSWSSGNDLTVLDRSLGSCDSTDDATQVEVTVSRCATPQSGEPVDPATCQAIRQETFVPQIPYGSFSVDDIPPGHYRAELRFGKLPPVSSMVETKPFQRSQSVLRAYYAAMHGSLTHGGEPLGKDAMLSFEGGVGFSSGETGEYHAVMLQTFREMDDDLRIDVATCDERFRTFVLTDRPLRSHTRYDIDIPDNTLIVNVTDTFTQMALRAATLRYVVMSQPAVERVLKSEGESEFILKAVPERRIQLSVRHAGYQEHRVPPFTMPRSGTKTIDVQLVPLQGSGGRIISSLPFESGMVLWLSPVGIETERADLAPDGTFVYTRSHTQDETLAVVSLSHPLWVFRAPTIGRKGALEIRFPHGVPAREFGVLLQGAGNDQRRLIGLVVGGILVPHAALRAHQTLRKLPSVTDASGRLRIRDIAETGPIDVVLGPAVNDVPSAGRSFDPLMLPQGAEAQRQRLTPGMTEVVFVIKSE